MITVYGDSRPGLIRKVNEDCIFTDNTSIFLLADGMGGYEGGQVASFIAVDKARCFLESIASNDVGQETVRTAVEAANDAVLLKKENNENLSGMGTTMLVSHLWDNHFVWAYVGDSRIYLYRERQLRPLTTDHSFVMELLKEGKITEKEMKVHPRRNEITRAVGVEKNLIIDTGEITLVSGDILVLCSDGLSGAVSDEQMRATLGRYLSDESNTLSSCGEELFDQVYINGARDNVSVILIEYKIEAV